MDFVGVNFISYEKWLNQLDDKGYYVNRKGDKKMNKMVLPESVSIASVLYLVEMKENVIIGDATNFAGSCCYYPPMIKVKQGQVDDRLLETYIHEVVHAMLYEANLQHDDEEFVLRLGKILYQVVQDNNWNVGVTHAKSES